MQFSLELQGGIRSFADIERVLSYGIARVIIGTKAVSDPGFVKEAIQRFGANHIVVGVDARDGMVAVEGWGQLSDKTATSMCRAMKETGIHISSRYRETSEGGLAKLYNRRKV